MSSVVSKAAIVELNEDVQDSYQQAVELIRGIDDLNTTERTVVIKVGIFDHKKETPGDHATVNIVSSIVNSFERAYDSIFFQVFS